MEVWRYAVAVLLGYLLGAVPSGLLVGKLVKGVDLRDFGSGKTGATNALRTLGTVPAVLVIALDLLKGLVAILIAQALTHAVAAECLAGLAAAIGHNWPVYAGFRGGRGVLVSYGIFWVLCWPAALASSAIGMVIIAVSRFVSLGVLVGAVIGTAAAIPLVLTGHFSPWVLLYAALGAALIVVRHRDNIERLRAGTERKLGQPAQPVA
ncbi:MAG TPA: glycerol-3-phosphate 1-O-acyltransferase PlsY [Chloroflexota bacterium]|jgi:glycerol-3-phosphate acyltransferase PlsY|nr:glycerol-3-phosphate 1-O-acyltransferase PlsY [Chloroflexota bacterium]